MNTEMTKTSDTLSLNGRVFYDGECPVCIGLVERFGRFFQKKGYAPLPLQTEGVRERLGVTEEHLLDEMRVLTKEGSIYGGADAVLFLAGLSWWTKPISWIGAVGFGRRLFDKLYKDFARRRYCTAGACHQSNLQRGKL